MPPPAPAGERSGAPDQPRRISHNDPLLDGQRAAASSDKTVCSCDLSPNVEPHVSAACEVRARQPPVTPRRAEPHTPGGGERAAAASAPRTVLRQASRMEPLVEAHEAAVAAAAKAKKTPVAPPLAQREAATSSTLHRSASRTPRTSPFLLSDPVTSLEHLLPSSPPAQSQPQRKPPPQRASSTRRCTTSVQALPPGSALRDASIDCGGPGVLKLSESDAALLSSVPRRGTQSPTRVHGRMPPPRPLKMSPEPRRVLQPRTNSGPLVSHKGHGEQASKRVRYDDDIVDDEEPAGPSKKAKFNLAAHEDVFGPAPPPVALEGARDQRVMRRNGTPQGSGSRPNVRVPSLEVLSEMRASSSHAAPQQQPQQRAPSPAPRLPEASAGQASSPVVAVDDLSTPTKISPEHDDNAQMRSSAPPSIQHDEPEHPPPALAVTSSGLPAALKSSEDDKPAKPPTQPDEERKRELPPATSSPSPGPELYAPPSESAVLRRVMSHSVHLPAPPEPQSTPEPVDPDEEEPQRSPSPHPDDAGPTAAERREAARLHACHGATVDSAQRVLSGYLELLSTIAIDLPPDERELPTNEETHAARVAAHFLGGILAVDALHDCLNGLFSGDLCLDDLDCLRELADL